MMVAWHSRCRTIDTPPKGEWNHPIETVNLDRMVFCWSMDRAIKSGSYGGLPEVNSFV